VAIITISRGSLSGGRTVAECLCERLGCPCVADEVLQKAATKLQVSEDAVRGKFETAPGLWSRLSRERERYVLAVQTALAEACAESELVYHGLAGQFLLRGLPGVFRVRLIAPLEMRTEALRQANHAMSRRAAEEFIRTVDRERERRVQAMFGLDVEDPSLYDLTVNLRKLSLDSACAAIAEGASRPQFRITDEVRARHRAFAAECHRRLDEHVSGD
jgi:cytidylate kinase